MNRIVRLAFIVFGVGAVLIGCGQPRPAADDIGTIQEHYEAQLMSLPGVVGVGIGDCEGQACLKVFVEEKTPDLERQIPKHLEGVKVEIEVMGPVEIQPP